MKKELASACMASAVAIGVSATVSAAPKWAKKGDTIVKCTGVAKKAANDCGTKNHSCSNKAKADREKDEWVYVPEGVCQKLAGGVVWKKKKVD